MLASLIKKLNNLLFDDNSCSDTTNNSQCHSLSHRMKYYVDKHNGENCHPFKPHIISVKSKNMLNKINEVTDVNTKIELLKLYKDMMIDVSKVLYNRFDPHMMYTFNNELHFLFNYNDDGIFLYDGNIHKLITTICSHVTLEVNKRLPYDASFEATFTEFDQDFEALNFLIWRQHDCKRNVSSLLYKCIMNDNDNDHTDTLGEDVLHNVSLAEISNILTLYGYECPEFVRGTIVKKRLGESENGESTRPEFVIQHYQMDVDFAYYFNEYIDQKYL